MRGGSCQNLDDYLGREARRAFQCECMAQRGLSETEAEMDRKSWEMRNSDMALCEIQHMELGREMEFPRHDSSGGSANFPNLRVYEHVSAGVAHAGGRAN